MRPIHHALALSLTTPLTFFVLVFTLLVCVSSAFAQAPPPLFDIRAIPGDTTFEGGGTIGYMGPTGDAGGSFDLNVVFGVGLSPSQQAVFTGAEAFWENKITGYKPGISRSSITLHASAPFIDGPGDVLGRAGPTITTNQGGFTLATTGIMKFDSADVANLENSGSLLDVILHEMGHVLGIGTLWNLNNVYANNTGNYTGAAGLARWKTEYNRPGDTTVPVELEGANPGTANGHWNEEFKGSADTGITDSMGRDMRNELMTGWLNTPTHLADFTVQSLADIGFEVVPEPGTAGMALLAMLTIAAAGSRRVGHTSRA